MAEVVERVGYPYGERRISWAAVFGGVFVALACQMTLTLLGVGLGFAVLDPRQGLNALTGIGIGTGVWLFVSALISFYIGGWVAGRLAGFFRIADSVIHGILTWSVATVAVVFLFTQGVAGIIGGALGAAGQAAGGMAQAAGQASDKVDWSSIKAEAQKAMGAGQTDTTSISRALESLFQKGDTSGRHEAVRLLTQRGMSRAEAERTVQRWNKSYGELKTKATETAEQASTALASVSLITFASMALEALAAALGGRSAGRRLLHGAGHTTVARR